jgi:hypothetical protein
MSLIQFILILALIYVIEFNYFETCLMLLNFYWCFILKNDIVSARMYQIKIKLTLNSLHEAIS